MRIDLIKNCLREKILILDGAMGTQIQMKNLGPQDFGGDIYEGCNEMLNLTAPDVISSIHEIYLKAGADIIETNTFGGTPLVLAEYGLETRSSEINREGARLARELCNRYSTEKKPRFVAGSIGPTTKAISVTGGVTFDELVDTFKVQARALVEGGADFLLIETSQDMRNVKACLKGISQASQEKGFKIPVALSVTIEPMGTMLAGQTIEAVVASVSHVDLLYIGLNCATGPDLMVDPMRSLSDRAGTFVACVPNAGLPDEDGHYLEGPESFSKALKEFAQRGWLNLAGGCCGTTPEHIRALVQALDGMKPRVWSVSTKSELSGIDYLEIESANRPYLVGERTNVIGSKKFKDLIVAEKFQEAVEVARAQMRKGAHILDVCLANPDRDEYADMDAFLSLLMKALKAPLMIDSTDDRVVELALKYSQGKAIINSVNLEDGEERFEKILPLARSYGAALVVGLIDEKGMAVTRERKLEVAQRSYDLLTKKYGLPETDIYFDPLVFPCATGDQQYVGSAVETIEGVRLIKEAFPKVRTILGISNVSFGLPPNGREVLNSVFLYHCVQAGLDLAIVNTEKLERFASLPAEEIKLAENLLWNRGVASVDEFVAFFRSQAGVKKTSGLDQNRPATADQRLSWYIREGIREGLHSDLDECLRQMKPLDIINGPLMRGMDEVGKLFAQNQLIVAEVLQSAEVMKAAVHYLEPHMEKSDSALRGKVILATVKGDVHDIGKNLVDIIFSNNGFQIINLGIKVTSDQLIQGIREHKPHIVGLSGLLVKSAQQMTLTADDLRREGIDVPLLVGGAALTKAYTDRSISQAYGSGEVFYAADAMKGLDLAKSIVSPEAYVQLKEQTHQDRRVFLEKLAQQKTLSASGQGSVVDTRSKEDSEKKSKLRTLSDSELPIPSDHLRHRLEDISLDILWKFLNPLMLYSRHLGLKGADVKAYFKGEQASLDGKSREVFEKVEEVKSYLRKDPSLLRPRAVYQFFSCRSQGERIELLNQGQKIGEFVFPRQEGLDRLCLADYVSSNPSGSDSVALFVVTAGARVRSVAEQWKHSGEYLACHILQALALESAESFAEYLHSKIRGLWGFPDHTEMTMMDRFQAKYRGRRYSFGYPACPELSDQKILFDLLKPQDIGVELTDGFMMEPEASVSAMVFHHPEAKYFAVGESRV